MRGFAQIIAQIILLIGVVSCPVLSWAARPATVESKNTLVLADPSESSRTIEVLQPGTSLAVSNIPTQGFYKVRTPKGNIGWIKSENLVVKQRAAPPPIVEKERSRPSSRRRARRLRKKSRESDESSRSTESSSSDSGSVGFKVSAFGGYNYIFATDLNAIIGETALTVANHLGLEAGVYPFDFLGFILRFEYLFASISPQDSNLNVYDWSLTSFPLYLGAEVIPYQSEWIRFQVAAFLGYGYLTELESTAVTYSEPNVTQFRGNPFVFVIRTGVSLKLLEWISLGGNVGFRYHKTSLLEPRIEGNGSSIFKDSDGNFKDVRVDFTGFLASFDLSFYF